MPALDAVLFLNPRKSQIDVVQSVGRVMRRAEGKKYGYIILPIGIPADMPAEEALKDNEKYKVVWQVLQALRAHDDRFNATVNHIELNKQRPDVIQVIGVSGGEPGDEKSSGDSQPKLREVQSAFAFPHLEEWKDAIYARIVLKCGERAYWEVWAKDVAVIAERHTARIRELLAGGEARHKKAFADFLAGLRDNINPSISEDDAIEMLSQHLITRPVFDALFENYAFTKQNPVSIAMQSMLELLHDQALEKETASLAKFYDSVRLKATGIDNAEGRQRVVIELYDKFFRTAFPKMAERLGIVYTPVEVVDFIIRSVEDVLQHEFKSSLGAQDVHVIDPFTGTGTFIVRLLQSGLISPADLLRKYQHELHANEIVLLAYYIAAINIEETFHGLRLAASTNYSKNGSRKAEVGNSYLPFDGMVLTDTFQMYETKGEWDEKYFPENNRRVKRQKQSPIRVVIGNPPYSGWQDSANDSNTNLKYPKLDEAVRDHYAEHSSAQNKSSLYNSYVRAFRWATDRINGNGIVCFVSNGFFIDGKAADGMRKAFAEEFADIYCFNLRGDQINTSGDVSRREGGKIFGSGSRSKIAITLLVKKKNHTGPCRILYHDVGDYLSREEKLAAITSFGSVNGIHRAKQWKEIHPNAEHDWINQRDPAFAAFVPLGEKADQTAKTVFECYSRGLETARDAWCYNFSKVALAENIKRTIAFYNQQVDGFARASTGKTKAEIAEAAETFADHDPKKISWSRALKRHLVNGRKFNFEPSSERLAVYRPFCNSRVYLHGDLNNVIGSMTDFFPADDFKNVAISVSEIGSTKEFSALVTNKVPDLHLQHGAQWFPLYVYEKDEPQAAKAGEAKKMRQVEAFAKELEGELVDGYRRRSAITDEILADFRKAYEARITKEDIFYYVYGVLHSPEYRTRFASDLKKRVFRDFSG